MRGMGQLYGGWLGEIEVGRVMERRTGRGERGVGEAVNLMSLQREQGKKFDTWIQRVGCHESVMASCNRKERNGNSAR